MKKPKKPKLTSRQRHNSVMPFSRHYWEDEPLGFHGHIHTYNCLMAYQKEINRINKDLNRYDGYHFVDLKKASFLDGNIDDLDYPRYAWIDEEYDRLRKIQARERLRKAGRHHSELESFCKPCYKDLQSFDETIIAVKIFHTTGLVDVKNPKFYGRFDYSIRFVFADEHDALIFKLRYF